MSNNNFGKNLKECGCYTTMKRLNGRLRPVTIFCNKHGFIARNGIKVIDTERKENA